MSTTADHRAWLRREGEFWTLEHAGETVHVRDGKGVRYLAVLFEHPEREIHARDLAAAGEQGRLVSERGVVSVDHAELHVRADAGDAGPALDEEAKRAYRIRLAELESEVDEAESFNDPERAARAREELEFVQRELAAAVGLGGRDRPTGSDAERARVNVTRAIRSAMRRIARTDPVLGRYLELSVKTGVYCAFRPPAEFSVGVGERPAAAEASVPVPEPAPAPNAPPLPAPPGRALRTFVHVELANALELAVRLGEERWLQTLGVHERHVRERAAATGGHVEPDAGERSTVVFDGPDAAVRFGEQVAVEARAQQRALRIGVHTGECEVLAGTHTGIAVHAAARVGALAEPGEVLITSVVRDLVPGAAADDRGVHVLRGVSGEWRLHALTARGLAGPAPRAADLSEPGEAGVPLPSSLVAAVAAPLFGRTAELERVEQALERARDGGRAAVLLGGEPGVGKSRLAAEVAARAHAEGATVLHGRCDEDVGIAYQPVVEALGHLVEHVSPAIAQRVRGRALSRLVPQLRGDAPPVGVAGSGFPARDEDRYVLFAEVATALAASPRAPVVLVLDDLHWAGAPTLQLVRSLLRAPALGHLLVIGTYRTTDVDGEHPIAALLDDDGTEAVLLDGLDQADILALVAQLVGRDLPPQLLRLARQLSSETRGNAFFLTEILRHLGDGGDLDRIAAGAGDAPGEFELPSSVRETVARRVGRLGAPGQELLDCACVVGPEFDSGLLARVLDRPEDDVLDLLDDAVSAGLVVAPSGPGRSYRFAHALVSHALYERLAPGRRRRIHRAIGEALEAAYGADPGARIADLAHHVIRGAYAEDVPKALDYAGRAGDLALQQLSPQEAERWYAIALELLDQVPAAEGHRRLPLLIGTGRAQCQSGNPVFRETLLQAAELARRTREPERLVEAALANTRGFASATGLVDAERVDVLEAAFVAVAGDDLAARARLLATLAAELTFSGDWERRRRLSDEALEVARRSQDAATLGEVLSARFMTIWTPETLAVRRADTEEELELALRDGDPLARFRALHWRAVCAVECGDLAEAALLVRREAALADELRQPTAAWLTAYDRATQALMAGLLDEALARAEEAGAIAGDSGQPEALAFLAGQLVNIRFEQGTLAELEPMVAAQVQANPGIPAFNAALALARCEGGVLDGAREVLEAEAHDGFASFPYDSNWLVGLTIYAEVCGRVGGAEAAARLFELLEPYADQVAFNSATTWGSVQRHLGNLAAVLGRTDEALQRLRDAAARHEAMGAPLWLARTRLDLARLQTGGDERRPLAELAMATARDLGAATIEARAVALLEESP